MKRFLAVVALVAALATSCAKRRSVPGPAAPRVGSTESGIASWYGPPHHGRRTSSGEIYDMNKLTAAHRTLPFGTMVRVHSLENGRTVDVRIIDRGPFVDGRIIDLSRAAAERIRMTGKGTALVRLRVLAEPPHAPGYYAVQLGAFRDRSNAERAIRELQRRYSAVRLDRRDGNPPLWRVLVGKEPNIEAANVLAARLGAEHESAFVVRIDGGAAH